MITKAHTTPAAPRDDSYAARSQTPLHALVFILPAVAAFELGFLYFPNLVQDIRARHLVSLLFDRFGAPALYAAPALILVVLLAMHIARRDPWRLRPRVLLGMAAESAALALPLFVIGQITALLGSAAPAAATAAHAANTQAPTPPPGFLAELAHDTARACGAGLYEEFVFRLAAIALAHFVLADLIGLSKQAAAVIAVAASAAAFALYHDLRTPAGTIDLTRALFLFIAGVYFAAVYLLRGFGIAVGVHALYDILAFQTHH